MNQSQIKSVIWLTLGIIYIAEICIGELVGLEADMLQIAFDLILQLFIVGIGTEEAITLSVLADSIISRAQRLISRRYLIQPLHRLLIQRVHFA